MPLMPERILPERINPVLKSPPQHSELVDNRRLGQTNLGERSSGIGPFSYVHLRVPLPDSEDLAGQELFGTTPPESYFLMRRSRDGFVSCTGMFKASFPWAKKIEEEMEKEYVKANFPNTSKEETAGNLWVEPSDALLLADVYGIRPWIEALLDNEPVLASDHRRRAITPPPPFFRAAESDAGSVASSVAPPSAGTRRRSTRSMSPSKRIMTPRKSRASKATGVRDSPLKKVVAPIIEKEETTTITTTEDVTLSATELTNDTVEDVLSQTTPVKKDPSIKVEVDEAVEIKGDVEVKTTHVKVELPQTAGEPPSAESTEEMIAKAREMVAEARKLEGESGVSSKRKVEDITEEDEEEADEDAEDAPEDDRQTKRTKVLQDQLKKEKVKTRALLGLSATLALGALLPYVL